MTEEGEEKEQAEWTVITPGREGFSDVRRS